MAFFSGSFAVDQREIKPDVFHILEGAHAYVGPLGAF